MICDLSLACCLLPGYLVELVVVGDSQLDVSGCDPALLVVSSSVSSQLQDLSWNTHTREAQQQLSLPPVAAHIQVVKQEGC